MFLGTEKNWSNIKMHIPTTYIKINLLHQFQKIYSRIAQINTFENYSLFQRQQHRFPSPRAPIF
ncbi:hypothetical protein ES703_21885 [subsurface metagenome]